MILIYLIHRPLKINIDLITSNISYITNSIPYSSKEFWVNTVEDCFALRPSANENIYI